MSAEAIAEWWPTFEEYGAAEGVKITTPCDELGYQESWRFAFVQQYGREPYYDAICVHVYPADDDIDKAVAHVLSVVDGAVALSQLRGGSEQVIIHEYAKWPVEHPELAIEFARESRDALERAKIPAAWFALNNSAYWGQWYDTALVKDGQLTLIGEAWRR